MDFFLKFHENASRKTGCYSNIISYILIMTKTAYYLNDFIILG